MARSLLCGVLLLAALCWAGEAANMCSFSTGNLARSCMEKIMNESRSKLANRINGLQSHHDIPHYNLYELQYNSIHFEHASNIQLRHLRSDFTIPEGASLIFMAFHCYWQPSITLQMDVTFRLHHLDDFAHTFETRPTVNLKSPKFRKGWSAAGSGPGKITWEGRDIELNVVNATAFKPWRRWKPRMTMAVDSAVRKAMSDLGVEVDRWFVEDLFPKFVAEQKAWEKSRSE